MKLHRSILISLVMTACSDAATRTSTDTWTREVDTGSQPQADAGSSDAPRHDAAPGDDAATANDGQAGDGPPADAAAPLDAATLTPSTHNCAVSAGYSYHEHWATGTGHELHVVGIYESHSLHGPGDHPPGEARVHVARPGKVTLVLSSYEPVGWTVTAEPTTTLVKVLLNGYYEQTAGVPPGVPVVSYSPYNGPNKSLGCYPYEWPTSNCQMIAKAQQLTGLTLSSFRGCYRADDFAIGAPTP